MNSRTARANTGTYAAARCTIPPRPNQGTWADPTRSARGPLVANLAAFWQQISPIVPVLPTVPAHKCCAVYNLASEAFHGMEEVIGSIPIRSTKTTLMPSVYILQSESTNRFYIGCTTHLTNRVMEHQRGQTASTRGRGPWILVHREEFDSMAEARRRERQLKSWKSHRSILELIEASKR